MSLEIIIGNNQEAIEIPVAWLTIYVSIACDKQLIRTQFCGPI